MAKRNMKESMDNITNIKDSTAALSPEMQLAKEKAKDKDEEFEKIVLGKDVVLGASKQPTPDKPKWSLDESLFDKPISFEFDESLKESFYWLSDSRINILKRLGYSSKEDLAFAENLCEEEGLDLEEIVNTLDDIYKNGKEKAEAFYRDFFVDEDGNPIEIDESLEKIQKAPDVFQWNYDDDEVLEAIKYCEENNIDYTKMTPTDFEDIVIKVNGIYESLKGKKLSESYDDGWSSSIREELNDLTSELYSFCYEMENCVRGAYTGVETAEGLGDYLIDLGDRISSEGEVIKDYPTEDGEDDEFEDVDESLNEETTNPYGKAIPYQVSDELWRVRLSNRYKDLTEYDVWGYGSTTKPKDFYSEIAAEDAAAEYNQRYEDIEDELDESLSDREDIQNEIHRYNLLAPRYDKQSIIDELINDGYSYEEAEYIANHTTNLDESLRKDKNMKRYIIEEMKEDDQITDIDAYNESRDAKLVKRYKSILGLDEDFEITEENLDDWALKHACSLEGANYDRAKAAVLGLKFEGYK